MDTSNVQGPARLEEAQAENLQRGYGVLYRGYRSGAVQYQGQRVGHFEGVWRKRSPDFRNRMSHSEEDGRIRKT
jgi:hypothetical protein